MSKKLETLRGGLNFEGRKSRALFPTKTNNREEHKHQCALIDWARWSARLQKDPVKRTALEKLHHIPNGGLRDIGTALSLKRAGVVPGVCDLFLPYVARAGGEILYPGLYIEMKSPGEKPTPEQHEFIDYVRAQGYQVHVCYSWIEAAKIIISYMNLTEYGKFFL